MNTCVRAMLSMTCVLLLQSPDAGATDPGLEEVVVTARRVEERLQNVPVSASAFSTLELERRQIDNVSALQYAAPNLTVTPFPGTQTRANIAMRGQVEPELFPTLDPAVGVYLDGVYIARSAGANLDLIDMERVEVLRGPQGTLFGRNTIGGAINLVPTRPSGVFAGAVTAGVGDYDRRDVSAFVNIPLLGDEYVLRLTAAHREHSGYGRNTLFGRDLNADDRDFARIQLRLEPSDRWEVDLAFDVTRVNAARNLLTLVAAYPPNTSVPAARGNPSDSLDNYEHPLERNVPANRIGDADAEVGGASAAITIDFSQITLKTISAYRYLDSSDHDADLDGTPYDLFTVLQRHERQHQFSQELQLYGDALGQRLGWISGLYYFEENDTFSQRIGAVAPITLNEVVNLPRGTVDNDSMAAYAQITYAITPKLRLTVGARYNEDGRQLTSRNARVVNGIETCTLAPDVRDRPDECRATLPDRQFDYVPYTIGIDFSPVDTALLYAKVSSGKRAGGYNMRGTTETDFGTFEPEEVTAYEVGTRADLLSQRLRINLSLYRSLFTDIQLLERVPVPGSVLPLPMTENGGKARIDGGELEVTTLLGTVRVSGALGITNPQYTKLNPRVFDVTLDSRFLQTPNTTASIAVDVPFWIGFGEVNLHADYSWRDDVMFRYDPRSLARQDAYGLLNAMLTAQFDQTRFEFALWARNLTDKRYLIRATDSVSLVTAMPGDPRTYGVSLTYRFGVQRALLFR